MNATIPFAVLTDFEQFRLYDTTLKPILSEPLRGLVREWSLVFQDYPDKWDLILATFGRDAVVAGSLERLLATVKRIKPGRRIRTVDRMLIDLRGAEPPNVVFLDYLERFRKHFARGIYRENKRDFPEAHTLHGAATLTEAVQRLMDRLVFMRVCEDRGIAEYGGLRRMLERIAAEGGDFYSSLVNHFRDLDREYNGYVFKYHFSESLTVPDTTLADFVRTLYPPDGPWDFAAIADDILAIVYERFLGNVVTVHHGIADVKEKPEVRHAGGVYYTPRFVVDSIIRRVVGPKVAKKTPVQVLDVKILDPACGSGSFLVAAFQYLIDHCIAAVTADPRLATVPATPRARKKRKEIAFQDDQGRWLLAPDFKAELLTSCIHGVDIDQQAVEVTVMSLYLKMLEGALPKNWQRDWLENELLPPLDGNILCGNSLIDDASFSAYAETTKATLFEEDKDTAFRINPFDWTSRTRGFGRLLDTAAINQRGRAGFDCIIGNPPYIRVQELKKWAPEECEFYKWKYKSAAKGNYDIYVVFTEKALSLLAPDGLLGFIMPHKWWQAKYGEGLRKLIGSGKHLTAVVDFGDQQVFRGATTYTAIHVLSGAASSVGVEYAQIVQLEDGVAQCAAIDAGRVLPTARRYRAEGPTATTAWTFVDAGAATLIRQVAEGAVTLGRYASKIFVGLQTSADKVFILEQRDNTYWSAQLDSVVELEPTFLHPLLKGSVHMKRWLPLNSEQVVLFPYRSTRDTFGLVGADDIAQSAPKTWSYLNRCRPFLSSRERGTFEGARWYGYVYPKNLSRMDSKKILTPSLGRQAEYCYDSAGDYYFVGSGGGGGGGYGIVLPNDADTMSTSWDC